MACCLRHELLVVIVPRHRVGERGVVARCFAVPAGCESCDDIVNANIVRTSAYMRLLANATRQHASVSKLSVEAA